MTMPVFTFNPLGKTTVPRLGITGPGEYELGAAEVAELNGRIDGKDGAPAFVPVGEAAKAKKPKPAAAAPVVPENETT